MMTQLEPRTLTSNEIWWDTQDPTNPGWAYRGHYSDRHQESGPIQVRRDAGDARLEREARRHLGYRGRGVRATIHR